MQLPLDAGNLQLVWTALGRLPALAVLLFLTWEVRRSLGTRAALLGAAGFAAGALAGTALVPSILGALGGGFAGALLSWSAIGAPWPSPRLPTFLLLGVVALGRWGCFLSGCCFGHPTDSAWGVVYGPHSLAHLLHEQLGWVGAADSALPVVPLPLLESLGLVCVLGLGAALRKRLTGGALALVLLGATLVLRAAIDPLRAMVNTASSVSRWGPLSAFQWGALAAAAACFALAWRSRRAAPVRRPPRRAPAWVFPAVWVTQVAMAIATEGQGIWFLRVLSVAASTAAAAALLREWEFGRRLRPAFAAAAIALLLPVASRAGEGPVRTLRGDWLYIVVPRAQTLVRVGTASQPPEELEEKAAAILGQEPSPPSPPPPPPPLPQSPAPLAQPEPLAVAPLPEPGPPVLRNRLSVSVLGGRQAYYFSSCSGGTSGLLDFGNVAVQYEHEGTLGASTSGVTLVRARGLAGSDPSGFTGGTALTGLYEFRWKHVSLGVGLTFSVLSSFSNSVLPQSLYFAPGYPSPTGLALGVMPLLYLRFEALMGFAFELGTGSIFQPQDGVFAGFRWGFDEAGKVAVRAGVESTWLPHPLSNTNLFTDVGIPLGTRHRLHFRLMGHPWNAPAISGGLRWSFQF